MKYEINKNLFAAYCGLTVSGYDMAQVCDTELLQLISSIKKLPIPLNVFEYFIKSKTSQILVNPYFPRANAISAACFYLEGTLENYIHFIQSTGTMDCDEEFCSWISELPKMIDAVMHTSGFVELWNLYKSIVTNRMFELDAALNNVESALLDYGYYMEDLKLIFSPNLLQSPYLADYVLYDSKLYVISTYCNEISLLHEYLHIAISALRPQLKELVQKFGLNTFVDVKKIANMGYMLNDSIESQCHTLEDCIVRGLSAIMSSELDITAYCEANEQSGFHFAIKFIAYAQHKKPTLDTLIRFVGEVISFTK